MECFDPRRRGKSDHTKLGVVIQVVRTILAPLKRVRIRRIVSPLGCAENDGEYAPPKFKPPPVTP